MNSSGDADINALEAWDIYPQGGSWDVIIAIVDTGVDYNHNDFGRDWLGPYPNQKVVKGYNTSVDPADNNPMDDNGHGTHVAGVAAALTHNIFLTAGVAGGWNGDPWWNPVGCRIMPVKVTFPGGSSSSTRIAAGIDSARANGAHVINMSIRTPDDGLVQTVHDALWNAYLQDIVLVAAAGNDASQSVIYPAEWSEFVITVAGIDSLARKWFYSNLNVTEISPMKGKMSIRNYNILWFQTPSCTTKIPSGSDIHSNFGNNIDVTAPAVNIFSTYPGQTYAIYIGTSQAAAHVAGIAALIRSVAPSLGDGVDVEEFIERKAKDIGTPGHDIYFSTRSRKSASNCLNL